MAKLPARTKVHLLLFRRAGPDELLVVRREVKGAAPWALPSTEALDETAREAALRLAAEVARGAPLLDFDLGLPAEYRVKDGPRAGEWTERFHAVEMPPDSRARDGAWLPHYDAKAKVDAPRVRDAITRLRERAPLVP